jgi:hypothetical protein
MAQQNTSENVVGKEDSIQQPVRDEELEISNEKPQPKKAEPVPAGEEDDEGKVYPPARKVAVVMVALYLSLFLVSLVKSNKPLSPFQSQSKN